MGAATVEIEGAADPLPNPKHEAFARLVAHGMPVATAYRESGYVSKTPDAHGARLADSGSVAARIAYLRMERSTAIRAASLVDAHRIQQELEHLALTDIGQAFEEVSTEAHDGTSILVPRMLPLTRWPESLRRAVQKIKVKRYLEGSGDEAREVELIEFGLAPKTPALHELRAHMGLLKPIDVNLTVRGVIALPVMTVPQPQPGDRVLEGEIGTHTPAEQVASSPGLSAAKSALLSLLSAPT